MGTPALGAAMKGPFYSLRGNGAQHGGHEFHACLATFQGSTPYRISPPAIAVNRAFIRSLAEKCITRGLRT